MSQSRRGEDMRRGDCIPQETRGGEKHIDVDIENFLDIVGIFMSKSKRDLCGEGALQKFDEDILEVGMDMDNTTKIPEEQSAPWTHYKAIIPQKVSITFCHDFAPAVISSLT